MRPSSAFVAVLALATPALPLAACGGRVAHDRSGDASPQTGSTMDSGHTLADGGSAPGPDGTVSLDGGGSGGDGASGVDALGSGVGGGYVDAGYYYGDGSYWVDGGAYSDLEAGSQGAPDSGTSDAAPGCAQLSACCATLTSGTQLSCESIAAAGDATSCATELADLQAGANCTGAIVLASQIQPASRIVSDGTTLFWTTFQSSPGLFAMPVHGGPVTTLLAGETGTLQGNQFLAVDDTNVYVLEGYSLVRIPKDGGPATLVNETGATVVGATALGGLVYWTETVGRPGAGQPTAVKSAPLLGNTITTIGVVTNGPSGGIANLGVTSTTAFLGPFGLAVSDFPLSGLPASGPALLDAGSCSFLASDTDAIYCPGVNAMNLRIASDGTVSPLGTCENCTFLVSDDSYVYWVDSTLVGGIVKAPKAGGGTFTAIASDTTPTAIGVDGMAVYWTDEGGYFKSIPK